MAQEQMTQF
jgi:hypothetical protein